MVRKGKKKAISKPTLPLAITIFTLFQPSLLFEPLPPTISLVFDIFSNIPTIPHPLSIRDPRVHAAICDISDESNKNCCVRSLELILSSLLCVSSDMETNSFT